MASITVDHVIFGEGDGFVDIVVRLIDGGAQTVTVNSPRRDGTIVTHFGAPEGGTAQTLLQCIRIGRPYLAIDAAVMPVERAAALAAAFIAEYHIETLNVARPRASKESGATNTPTS